MVIFFDKFFKGMWLNGIFMLYFYEFYDIFTSFYDLNAYTSVCMCICTHNYMYWFNNYISTGVLECGSVNVNVKVFVVFICVFVYTLMDIYFETRETT